jgi:serine/threonine protein kinase
MNIIHKYKIIKKINSGGQGTFYLVKYKNRKNIKKSILRKIINQFFGEK